MNLPLVDLAWQHDQISQDVERGLAEVFDSCGFVLGPAVAAFEREYAAFSGVAHCVGVASGTDAVEFSLRAAGVTAGAEVIVPAHTFAATALAAQRVGARVVPVDVDPDSLLLDPAQVEPALGPRTRAIVPVHLYGQMCDMEPLEAIAASADVPLVEDAAQAQGASRNGRPAGSWGVAAGTSFYPSKNLGAYGDAGAILTESSEIASALRRLRNYGSEERYLHPTPGWNSRLDTVQAVVLRAKLQHLGAWNEARRGAAARYDELLAPLATVGRPRTLPGNEHVWHLYVIRVPERDRVLASLRDEGIGAAVHYPRPFFLEGAFADLGHESGDFPVAERAAREILSLPIFPGITASQQERVAEALARAVGA